MATIIDGYRQRDDLTGERRIYDVKDDIETIHPEQSEVTVLFSKVASQETTDPKYFMHSVDEYPEWVTVNGAHNSSTTTLTVTDTSMLQDGDMLINPATDERILITDVASTTSLTVLRGHGGSADSILAAEQLLLVSDSHEEGAVTRSIKSVQVDEQYNYTQIIKTEWGVTNTEMNSKSRGKTSMEELAREKLYLHRKKIEKALIYSTKAEITTGDNTQRTTDGFINMLTSNIYDFSMYPTEYEMDNFLEAPFTYGSKRKWFICGPPWVTLFTRWAKGKLQISDNAKKYGLPAMKSYESAHGSIDIIKSHVLAGTYYKYWGMLLDPKYAKMRYLSNRKWRMYENVQLNDADGKKNYLLSEIGAQSQVPDAQGLAKFRQ